jgi:hypothetical protein
MATPCDSCRELPRTIFSDFTRKLLAIKTQGPQFAASRAHARAQNLEPKLTFPLVSVNARAAHGLGNRLRGFPLQDVSLSAKIRVLGPPCLHAKTPKGGIPAFSVKPCQVVPHARARVRKIRFFDHPYNPRKREQSTTRGGKAVELVVPEVLRNAQLALASPTWARGCSRVLRHRACPRGAKNEVPVQRCTRLWASQWARQDPEKQNSCFSLKPCQVVAHARARVGKIPIYDRLYTPRKREQSRANGGKAVDLAKANALQFIAAYSFSALLRFRGQWTDLLSAHSLSVDWQAWGTKGGLCWRATRDGLRHVPAGPPKSCALENPLTPFPKGTRKLRLSARRATIPFEYVPQGIQAKTARETAPSNRNLLSRRAPSAGAG